MGQSDKLEKEVLYLKKTMDTFENNEDIDVLQTTIASLEREIAIKKKKDAEFMKKVFN
jgi:hypothetical protein